MAITLTIGGTERVYRRGSLEITEQINSRNRLSLVVLSTDGSYRPSLDDEIIIVADGTRIFGGNIDDISEAMIATEYGGGTALAYDVGAVDFNALADRRYAAESFPSQQMKTSFLTLDNYLTAYGVALDAGNVAGPVLPAVSYNTILLTDIFDELAAIATTLTGPPQAVVWEIDYNKVLRFWGVLDSGHAAPFNIVAGDANVFGDVKVRPSRTDYANYIMVMCGEGAKAVIDFVGTGDGVTTTFHLHYPTFEIGSYVNVGGTLIGDAVTGVISGGTNESVGLAGSGATWIWDPPLPNNITRTSAPSVGQKIHMPMTGSFPVRVDADGGAAASARVDRVYVEPEIFDYFIGQAVANAILQQANQTYKEVIYESPTAGCHPGQTQTITIPKHGLSGSHLITEVRIRDYMETRLTYEIKAITGTAAIPESWMSTYQLWGKSGGGAQGGSFISVVSGSLIKPIYFLGGSESLYVQTTSGAWVAADAVRVTIDTSVRGSLLGTVRLRLRAASGTVTARLRNITDSSTAGTSSAIGTTSWTDTSFSVTLAAGIKVYELQLSPSISNVDIAGVGYFE